MIMSLCISYSYTEKNNTILNIVKSPTNLNEQSVGCVCAVFLNGQFKKGSREQPKGYPALLHEYPNPLPCSAIGNKLCTSKCLDVVSFYIQVQLKIFYNFHISKLKYLLFNKKHLIKLYFTDSKIFTK